MWLEVHRALADFADRYIASCLGDFLCLDHTFRIAKYIRHPDDSQSYLAVLSIKNERGQLVGYWFVKTTSLLEVLEALEKVQKRYEAAGSEVSIP